MSGEGKIEEIRVELSLGSICFSKIRPCRSLNTEGPHKGDYQTPEVENSYSRYDTPESLVDMDGICDITVPLGETYVHKVSVAEPPNPCKGTRSIVHFCRKTPATTHIVNLESSQSSFWLVIGQLSFLSLIIRNKHTFS